jgi:hypothetical protein
MAMNDSPSGLRYALAKIVRQMVADRGLRFQDISGELELSPSKLSRMFTGERPMGIPDLQAILLMLEVDRETREQLMQMCRSSRRRSSFYAWNEVLQPNELTFLDALSCADVVRENACATFPLLLQTREYHVWASEAWKRGTGHRRGELQDELAPLIYDTDRLFHFILDESVFLRGPVQMLRQQLKHLLELAERPNIKIYVHPWNRGANPGAAHPYTILSWASDTPPLLCQPGLVSMQIMRPGQEPYVVGLSIKLFDELTKRCSQPAELPQIVERSLMMLAQPSWTRTVVSGPAA